MADLAKKIHCLVGYPSIANFKGVVHNRLINNCPVTRDDIVFAERIYGANVSVLKGKTVRCKPIPVCIDYVQIPKELHKLHCDMTLAANIMFVQGIPFFVTVLCNIKFTTIEMLENRKKSTIMDAIKHVNNIHKSNGFKMVVMLMDPEFECL